MHIKSDNTCNSACIYTKCKENFTSWYNWIIDTVNTWKKGNIRTYNTR